tara:strand:- start:560 stop:937 length:378 start_codon:yes stop_codon:yes gene_type:complete
MQNTSKKGFTLVEIMIVVVIIGLLAAMAIPAFAKVRQNSRHSAMDNDARQLASAAQQYMLENSVTTATLTVNATTGVVSAPLADYVKQVGKGYTTSGTITSAGDFTITHAQAAAARTYNAEGQYQ